MIGFGLLLGHLVGDYVVQNDWMAKNKTNPFPGPRPTPHDIKNIGEVGYVFEDIRNDSKWLADRGNWFVGHLACLAHCVLYTFAVWAFSFWWMPWWGLLVCFVVHFPIDRWRLAGLWMRHVGGQSFFASKEHPMFPWSIVMVDNIFHLLTLLAIAVIHQQGK